MVKPSSPAGGPPATPASPCAATATRRVKHRGKGKTVLFTSCSQRLLPPSGVTSASVSPRKFPHKLFRHIEKFFIKPLDPDARRTGALFHGIRADYDNTRRNTHDEDAQHMMIFRMTRGIVRRCPSRGLSTAFRRHHIFPSAQAEDRPAWTREIPPWSGRNCRPAYSTPRSAAVPFRAQASRQTP